MQASTARVPDSEKKDHIINIIEGSRDEKEINSDIFEQSEMVSQDKEDKLRT